MLQQVFKLTADQYEDLYKGNVVTSSDSQTTLQLNLTTRTLTINDSTELTTDQYIIETSDKYLEPSAVENMFDDNDSVASTQDVADLFSSFTPELRLTIADLIFPVGSIFTTYNNSENVTTLHNRLGGTWEALNSGNAVKVPLGSTAPVRTSSLDVVTGARSGLKFRNADGTSTSGSEVNNLLLQGTSTGNYSGRLGQSTTIPGTSPFLYPSNLVADLSSSLSLYMFRRIA